jgi:hypothetical protein
VLDILVSNDIYQYYEQRPLTRHQSYRPLRAQNQGPKKGRTPT